ncbi:uncharacterized protein LOC118484703 [Helianthus annuus]|nr:uncharacterized protein LOC118484703 [Helianthus annuus]
MSFSPAPGSSTSLYKCESKSCNMRSTTFRMCPSCPNKYISAADGFVLKPAADAKPVVGFVKGLVTYMVMDDLAVSPMSTISNITLLNKFNIKDLGDLEEKVVDMGMNEGLELLKHSLNSKTVLTNVFLGDNMKKRKSDGS